MFTEVKQGGDDKSEDQINMGGGRNSFGESDYGMKNINRFSNKNS